MLTKKKAFFVLRMSFNLIRKEEKIMSELPKYYGASQYIKRLP